MTGLPALLGALGVVGVVFALLSLVVLIFSGAGLGSDLFWVWGNLAVGVLLLVSSGVLSFDALRERMASGEARRAGKYGSSALASTLLGIAILGMLGFVAERNPKRFDWTEQHIHTLSDQTLKVLAGLDKDVDVMVLVSKLDAPPIRELLDRYTYASPRFKVDYADPNERPGLLQQYHITPEELKDGKGLIRMDIGGNSVEITEISEPAVTNAMVKLTRTGDKVVYFIEGHGERPVDGDGGKARTGYGLAADALRNENYRVQKLLLAAQADVPPDASVVVLAGPRRGLLDVEYQALDRYLGRGGSVLALVDPRVKGELIQHIAEWGVTLDDDVVIDRTLALFGRAMSPFAASYDITKDLHEPTLFHEARSITVGNDFAKLVLTGDDSWGEHDLTLLDTQGKASLDDNDERGPVVVGVAGTPKLPPDAVAAASPKSDVAKVSADGSQTQAEADEPAKDEKPAKTDDASKKPRLVVYGDADFASNEYISAYRNRDLFLNSVNWLIGDVEAISVRPNKSRASRFQLTAEQFRTIRQISLFVLPELIAVLGVFTWWSRRHPAS